jgi:subtilase family serine protease
VTGLDTEPHLMQPNARPAAPPSTGFITGRPCSGYYGQLAGTYKADHQTRLPQFQGKTPPYAVCGYTPAQFRSIYGATASKLTGAGQTIGVVDAYASPTVLKDANTYSQRHGDPAFQAGRFTQSNAGTYRFGGADLCDERGWYGEETLDVEAAHGMAPAAGVRYYGAASCLDADLYDAQARVVDENRVAVVSDSFGSPDEDESAGALVQGSFLYQQAAMQGISVLFSSGDDGDEVAASRSQSRQTTSPASNPYVTAVGGTSTAIGASRNRVFQTGWGTHTYALSGNGGSWIGGVFLYGAGGGESALYSRPSYQSGVVPASVGSGRAVPDVAMDGDPTTGMLIGQTQTFGRRVAYGEYRIGGTSLASPLMAGMVALAGQHSGKRVGFLNPTIYGQVKGGKGTFTDVKAVHVGDGNIRADFTNTEAGTGPIVYSVRTFGQDSSLSLGTGWDETTGLGTPNAKFLTSIN